MSTAGRKIPPSGGEDDRICRDSSEDWSLSGETRTQKPAGLPEQAPHYIAIKMPQYKHHWGRQAILLPSCGGAPSASFANTSNGREPAIRFISAPTRLSAYLRREPRSLLR